MDKLPFQKPRVRLHGDKEIAQRYLGSATAMLHQVERVVDTSGVPVFSSTKKLDDGTVIYAGIFGQERIVEIWPVGFDDEEEKLLRKQIQVSALAWLPVGFSFTDHKSVKPQSKILTNIPRNNYPEFVFRNGATSPVFNYEGLFYSKPLRRRSTHDTDSTTVVGFSATQRQDNPRFRPAIFSDKPEEINDNSWQVLSPEDMPLNEVYSGITLEFASEVASRITNTSVRMAPRGSFSALITRYFASDDLAEVTLRSGVPAFDAMFVQATNPQAAAVSIANALNNLQQFESSQFWSVEVAHRSGSYYALATATSWVSSFGLCSRTEWGDVTVQNSPLFSAGMSSLWASSLRAADYSVYIRGARLFLRWYQENNHFILSAASVGDGVVAVISYTLGSNKVILRSEWDIKDLNNPVSSRQVSIPTNTGAITSCSFSQSGAKFAAVLWERVLHPNSYVPIQYSNLNQRRTFTTRTYGTSVRLIEFRNDSWFIGQGNQLTAQVELSSTHRPITEAERSSWLPPLSSSLPSSIYDQINDAGYNDDSKWRMRTQTYRYRLEGSHLTALTYQGENLVTAELEHDIEIESITNHILWEQLVGKAALTPATDREFVSGWAVYKYFDRPQLVNSNENENTLVYRHKQTIKVGNQEIIAAYAELDSESDPLIEPTLLDGAHLKFFQYLDFSNLENSVYIKVNLATNNLSSSVIEEWVTPKGNRLINSNAMQGVQRRVITPARRAAIWAGRLPSASIFTGQVDTTTGTSNFYGAVTGLITGSNNEHGYDVPNQQQELEKSLCAANHVADIAPSSLIGFSNPSVRLGDSAQFTTLAVEAQAPQGIRGSFNNNSIMAVVRGQELWALSARKYKSTTDPVQDNTHFNWSTLDLQALGINQDERITPAGVLGE